MSTIPEIEHLFFTSRLLVQSQLRAKYAPSNTNLNRSVESRRSPHEPQVLAHVSETPIMLHLVFVFLLATNVNIGSVTMDEMIFLISESCKCIELDHLPHEHEREDIIPLSSIFNLYAESWHSELNVGADTGELTGVVVGESVAVAASGELTGAADG